MKNRRRGENIPGSGDSFETSESRAATNLAVAGAQWARRGKPGRRSVVFAEEERERMRENGCK